MSKEVTTIILAAGKGTRMKSNISKPMHKIAGLEIISHIIKTVEKIDTKETIIVVSEENNEDITKCLSDKEKLVIQKERKGTGDATKTAIDIISNINNPVLITYGDMPLVESETYTKMIKRIYEENVSIVALGFYTKDTTNKYGRFKINADNNLESIIEFKDATEEERKNPLCNAGIYVIKNAELLKNLLERIDNKNASGEYYLTDIIKIAYEQKLKCVYDIAMENEVMGVNSRNELAVAEKIFQDKKRQEFMLSGVTLQEPSTVYFSYDTIIENDVTIEPNVFFANGVKIKSGTVIKSFSYLEDCEINNNVTIGPFARIRPGTVLKNNCKVGNFCEIKKSTIGNGTKINHLSYIGDTEIGDNTNIGAGTITCNYNGYTKSKTKIGNNSFIGSNTIMIAPINIGNNTMTAAGSVITNDVIDGAIAISRSEQKNLDQGMIRYRKKMGEK